MAKLTKKQNEKLFIEEYNKQFNELFKLHKYLVESPYTDHTVGQGNPVDDAIKVIENFKLGGKSFVDKRIKTLQRRIDKLSQPNGWKDGNTAPKSSRPILLKYNTSYGVVDAIDVCKWASETGYEGVMEKDWVSRCNGRNKWTKIYDIQVVAWKEIR